MLPIKSKNCSRCNKEFKYKNITSIPKYCSWRCFQDGRNEKKKLRRLSNIIIIKLNCKFCNKQFKKPNNIVKLYCSKSCSHQMDLKRDRERKKHLLNTDPKFKEHYNNVRKEWLSKNKDKIIQYRKKAESKESYKIKRKLYLKIYESKPENKQRRLLWSKEWRKRDYVKDKKKAYKLKNKDYIKKQSKEYSQRPEIKERARNLIRERLKNDPIFILKCRLRTRFYQYVKRGLAKKKVSTSKLLGCDWLALKIHLEKQFKPGMNWKNKGKWHIDHIKPMAHFNLLNIKDQYKCCNYKNLKPLWATENLSKGARYIG